MLKLLDTSLKLKSTFSQGHFSGRNWIVFWMKMNEKSLKNSGKTYTKNDDEDDTQNDTKTPLWHWKRKMVMSTSNLSSQSICVI